MDGQTEMERNIAKGEGPGGKGDMEKRERQESKKKTKILVFSEKKKLV